MAMAKLTLPPPARPRIQRAHGTCRPAKPVAKPPHPPTELSRRSPTNKTRLSDQGLGMPRSQERGFFQKVESNFRQSTETLACKPHLALHHSAQCSVNTRLIAPAIFLEPRDHVRVEPQGDWLLQRTIEFRNLHDP